MGPASLFGLFGLLALCHDCVAQEVGSASQGFSMLQMGTDVDGANPTRHVYIDMGANWANTLRLYQDIVPRQARRQNWEIYAFEAHPLIQPYLEKFVKFLNGEGEKPALTVPPSGSTGHLNRYAGQYGCFMTNTESMRNCMLYAFKYQLNALRADPTLNSTQLVKERLAVAAQPLPSGKGKTRFTFIPAAVSSQDGWLHLSSVDPAKTIFGGAVSVSDGRSDQEANVVAVDTVSWMVQNFREEDYVVLKMDVEGAEFGILHGLYEANKLHLIDVLAYECHKWVQDGPPPMQNCDNMTSVLSAEQVKTLVEGKGYISFDSSSTPDIYKPVDPIIRSRV